MDEHGAGVCVCVCVCVWLWLWLCAHRSLSCCGQLRSTGGFHTCYSVWTGEVVGFVEPQYDSTGEFPLAVLHHYLLTGDETFLATVRGRVRELLGFFIDNVRAPRGSGRASITRNALCGGGATFPRVQVEYAGFVPSDYSIWEESSSGLTGKPLPTSYFSFTQSMAYAGLQAGALLEEHTWVNTTAAAELRARASQVVAAVENKLWLEDEGYYARDIWSNTLLVRCRGRCVCGGNTPHSRGCMYQPRWTPATIPNPLLSCTVA